MLHFGLIMDHPLKPMTTIENRKPALCAFGFSHSLPDAHFNTDGGIMTEIHRVSMGFAKFKHTKLGMFGFSVAVGMTDNPTFPNPPVSAADLMTGARDYMDCNSTALGGGRLATAARNAARARLIGLLRDEAHYVQIVAKNNLVALLSSGFTPTSKNCAQSPLIAPRILKVSREHSTQLWLRLKPVPNARSYQAQLKVGDGEWQDAGIHQQARRLILQDLVPGTVYQIRVRATGGSTGYSNWSMVTSCMAV